MGDLIPCGPQAAAALRRALLVWFHCHRRDLPWRRTRDPYAVWLSEIMLQQTRVETVIDYYTRFLERFPTVESLAAAHEDEILKLWEGLGYYSRALNLHKTAKAVTGHYKGVFPGSVEELRQLPGIGRYTAGAIASIAFGVKAPVLDGNVKRVLARLFAIEERIDQASTLHRLWELADRLVSPRSPGNFNQALMELGARICLPKNPACAECPVRMFCEARERGIQDRIPAKRPAPKVPHCHVVAAAIRKNGRYLLGKRPPGGMLGGLWEFPGGKVEPGETHEEALVREIREELGIEIRVLGHAASVDHAYSHLTVTLHLYLCEHIGGRPRTLYHSALKWVSRKQFGRYSFPAANLKFFEVLK